MLKYKVSLFLLVLNIISFIMATNFNNSSGWPICKSHGFRGCNCTNQKTARCYVSHVADIEKHLIQPDWFLQLDLSGNGIQFILKEKFSNFTNLIHLSLANNSIRAVSIRAFYGLARLRELNLRDNIIKVWDTTSIRQDFPSLSLLNVARNMYWKPDHNILSLPNLKVIYLLLEVTTHKFKSFRCYLVRENTTLRKEDYRERLPSNVYKEVEFTTFTNDHRHNDCKKQSINIPDSNFLNLIQDKGLYFHCQIMPSDKSFLGQDRQKVTSELNHINDGLKPWYYVSTVDMCWETVNAVFIPILCIALAAMVFNLVVVITTLRSRVLRESVAHVLVANLAVGDFLISLNSITVIITRQSLSMKEYDHLYLPYFCRLVGPSLLTGLGAVCMFSLVMTLERYLAVVYCMRPHIRVTMTTCRVAMVIVWSLSTALAICFMTNENFSMTTDDLCYPQKAVNAIPVDQYVASIGLVQYLLSIALYGHMYLDFKRTNQKTVQLQRENRLARRIAPIVFTNVFFVILPVIILVSLHNFKNYIPNRVNLEIVWKTFGITWTGLNSFLNPVLFSFRNGKFRSQFRRCFPYLSCINSVSEQTV